MWVLSDGKVWDDGCFHVSGYQGLHLPRLAVGPQGVCPSLHPSVLPSPCSVLCHRSSCAVSPALYQPQTPPQRMWLVVLMHMVIQLPTVAVCRRRQWKNPFEQENIPSPRGALGESHHGRAGLGSTRGEPGIHPPAKTPSGRDNPSSKSLDGPTKRPLGTLSLPRGRSHPRRRSPLGPWCFSKLLTWHDLPCCAVCQLCPSWLGGGFPPFQHRLGLHSSLPEPPQGVTTAPVGVSSSHPSSTYRV